MHVYNTTLFYLSDASTAYLNNGFVDFVVAVQIPKGKVKYANPGRHVWCYPTTTNLDLSKYGWKIKSVPVTEIDLPNGTGIKSGEFNGVKHHVITSAIPYWLPR